MRPWIRLTLVSLGSLAIVFLILAAVRVVTEPYSSQGAFYDPATNAWTAMSNSGAPWGREEASAGWVDGRFVVWGGKRFAREESGGAYDVEEQAWTALDVDPREPDPELSGEPGARGKPCFLGDRVVVVEGAQAASPDPQGEAWLVELENYVDAPRLYVYDAAAQTWSDAPLPEAFTGYGRRRVVLLRAGRRLVFWTGSKGRIFDMDSGEWGEVDFSATDWTNDGPFGVVWLNGRRGELVVARDSRLLVFSPRPAGSIYDVDANAWTAMSLDGAPSSRSRPVVGWTGSELVVWGGEHHRSGLVSYAQDGAVFDLKTNTWSPMAAGPLTARAGMYSAWSGSRLAVWGGKQDLPSYATSHFPCYQVLHMLLLAAVIFGPRVARVRGGESRPRGCLTSIGLLVLFGGASSALIFGMQWQLFDQLRSEGTGGWFGPSWAEVVALTGVAAFLGASLLGGIVTLVVPRKLEGAPPPA